MAECGSPEVDLERIYRVLAELTGLHGEDLAALKDLEIELEQQVCHPNPVMLGVFNYARAQGKEIVLCSDMYLSPEIIESLLSRCGYKRPYHLLVSNDLGRSKHEGSIWSDLIGRFGIESDRLVHFGDNLHADVAMPQQQGVRAHHFDYLVRSVETRLRMKTEGPAEGHHIRSLIQGTICERLMHRQRSFWEDIGLQIFGPLVLGKFLWFSSLARKERLERVVFFARDAYLPYHIYRKYGERIGIGAEAEYAYFSRAALLLPSFVDMPMDRVWHLFSGRVHRTVAEHLTRLGIDPHAYLHMIREVGFDSPQDEVPNGDYRMYRLLNLLWGQVLLEAKRRRPLAVRYVEEMSGSAKRIGIVDIGWTGNMQGGFSRLLQLSRRGVEITGFYYGTFDSIYLNYLPRNTYRGYLVNENNPRDWYHSLTSGGVELLEFALMAPHGTTLGYELQGGHVAPILESNACDTDLQLLAQQVQSGVMEFIDAAIPRVVDIGPEILLSSEWARPFFRLIDEPTLEEATLLGELTHSDSATDTTKRLHIAPNVLAEDLDEAGMAKARERAYWKRGFDVRNAPQEPQARDA